MPTIGIIMGSDSDIPRMRRAAEILDELKLEYEATICSAHRTPDRTVEWARGARDRGLRVIIAGAGASAALPGVVAAHTDLPVIGVPLKAWAFDGLDALLSMAQMPSGVPVATVAVNGAANGALLAARILAATDDGVRTRLAEYSRRQSAEVDEKDRELQRKGLGDGS
ncbi:MAG: 5-(carboxyamino)imidazole ribonucleotide mutase [Bacillota bacterium]